MMQMNAQEIESYLHDLSHGALAISGRLVDASNATLYASCEVKERSLTCIYAVISGLSSNSEFLHFKLLIDKSLNLINADLFCFIKSLL